GGPSVRISPHPERSRRIRPPHSPSSADQRRALGELAVEMERILGLALERRVIDMDEAEALAEAEAPFEIVEQRPDEIALHVDTRRNRIHYRAEIAAQIFDPLAVMDPAVAGHGVLEGGAVLGDVDRQLAGIAFLGAEPRRQEGVGRA